MTDKPSIPAPIRIPPTLSSSDIDELSTTRDLCNLLFYRNKNQHRRSAWWASLNTFRRELHRLVDELEGLGYHSSGDTSKKTKVKVLPGMVERVEARLRFWRDAAVMRWHHAFGQLVADSQFGVIGLVLMAALGRACAVTGVTASLVRVGEERLRRALAEAAASRAARIPESFVTGADEQEEEDMGQVVERGDVEMSGRESSEAAPAHEATTRKGNESLSEKDIRTGKQRQSRMKMVKKKKKKGNFIDDLFG